MTKNHSSNTSLTKYDKKYLIRLDDACPTMDAERWHKMQCLLDKYGIRPMVGIIPANADPKQKVDSEDSMFWQKALKWQEMGWAIALHGFDHCYISTNAGINPLWNRSEFAGVPLNEQKHKIREGVAILKNHGLTPKYFFAPSHTFDNNTLTALKEDSDIRIISDTIATKPYKQGDFIFIPQIGGHCLEMPLSGVYTFCFHPNTMNDDAFNTLETFIQKHKDEFCRFEELDLNNVKGKNIKDRIISWLYFTQRKIRKIK